MLTFDQAVEDLRGLFADAAQNSAQLRDFEARWHADPEYKQRRSAELQMRLDQVNDEILWKLERLVDFPPRHSRHFDILRELREDGWQYAKGVFVMTKYPQGRGKRAKELQRVIDIACAGVEQRGFVPKLAKDATHHDWLWDNVELQLLACERGIAIMEDRYKRELNPNIALEWGWMKGMGRDVLYLKEDKFRHERADWHGLLKTDFEWEEPEPGIEEGLDIFLGKVP